MKFSNKVIEFQNKEENRQRIVIARCGVFMVALGKDAKILNRIFGLKMTCLRPGLCKVGVPVMHIGKLCI